MCVMEIRVGQRTSTMAQAMAHNVSTVERDMDMLEHVLKARKDSASLANVQRAHALLKRAYADLLEQFGLEVALEVEDSAGHLPHDHDHGAERTFIEAAHHDASLARRYETR